MNSEKYDLLMKSANITDPDFINDLYELIEEDISLAFDNGSLQAQKDSYERGYDDAESALYETVYNQGFREGEASEKERIVSILEDTVKELLGYDYIFNNC